MIDALSLDPQAIADAWAARVRANRDQVERFQEAVAGPDFYAPNAASFRADPARTGDPSLNGLLPHVQPGEAWIDIGAGGGRFALPIARRARQVIAVEPSAGMRAVLTEGMADHGIANIDIRPVRWPAEGVRGDVAFIAHVGYDIEQIDAFIDAMEAAAPRRVAMLFDRQPTRFFDALWPDVHGEPRAELPALRDFLTLLNARQARFTVDWIDAPPQSFESTAAAITAARRQTWVAPGTAADERLIASVTARLVERDGRVAWRWSPLVTGIVGW